MLNHQRNNPAAFFTAFALLSVPAPLSDIVGVYALIDRVAILPDTVNPKTTQIWGTFAIAKISYADGTVVDSCCGINPYHGPQRGYLYYVASPGNERASIAEWRDLKRLAGTGRIAVFGSRLNGLQRGLSAPGMSNVTRTNGRVRASSDALAQPDTFPISFGVNQIERQGGQWAVHELMQVPHPISPAEGATVPAGAIRLVARSIKNRVPSYVFEIVGSDGQSEKSGPIVIADGETTWSPKLQMRAGQTYAWRVYSIQNDWPSPVASTTFRVAR